MARRRESFGPRRPGATRRAVPDPGTSVRTAARADAREIAARGLAAHAAAFPVLTPLPLETEGLDARDAALAHMLVDAVLRRWLTLSHLLNQFLRQPVRDLEPAMQGVLLSGAAQLLLLDRIPPHAALNESVELARRLVRPGAAGLTNAVLRRISELAGERVARPAEWAERRDLLPLSDGRALLLRESLLPDDALHRLSVVTSHPPGLLRAWGAAVPREQVRRLSLHSLVAPPTILNTRHAAAALPKNLLPHDRPGHHLFIGGRDELLALLAARGDLWVQDAASSRAIDMTAEKIRPSLIVDLCAGQGTKTRQLAAMWTDAAILATDVDPQRFATLGDAFRDHPRVRAIPPGEIRSALGGGADLVLADVPCSNTGVLPRRVEARYRAGREQLARLIEIQRDILRTARGLLRSGPRGKILYSTCSIEREENEFQADWASRELGLSVEHHELTMPAGLPGEPPTAYHDGAFHALLA